MKNSIYLIGLLLIGSLFNSCDSDDSKHQNKFETSEKTWMDFKKSSKNSYKYTVTFSSWVGFGWETVLTIKNGTVIQRDFQYTSREGLSKDTQQNELKWSETGAEIGTHKNGAEPMTLDEIYHKAKNDWLIERDNVAIYLETKNNGMISTCGYVDNRCADDCFTGVHIKSINTL